MNPGIGTAVAAGGTLIGALTGAAAARKKNAILTQGTREQDRAGMEAAGTMGDFINRLRGTSVNPATERGLFTASLGNPGVSALPTASSRFRTDARGATAGAQGYGSNLADLFARIRAPQLQHQAESEVLMGLGNALKPIQSRAQDSQFLTQMRTGAVQPNPWLGLLGKGLQQGGSYMVSHG